MKMNKLLVAPVAVAAIAAALSGCSRTTESLETTDVFAPAAEVAVPAPQIQAQLITPPPAIQSIVQAPAPIIAPPAPQAPDFAQVIAPPPVSIPSAPIIQAPAPVFAPPAPTYDCSVVPSSKSGLSTYTANCL